MKRPPAEFELSYASAASRIGTPGRLIALSVLSIPIALLALAFCIGSGMVYAQSWRLSYPSTVLLAPLPPTTLTPYRAGLLGPRGMPAEQRRRMVDSLNLKGTYARDQAAMVDRLLAEVGLDIVSPLDPTPLGAQATATRSGSQSRFEEPLDAEVQLRSGRLFVSPSHANFCPAANPNMIYEAADDGYTDSTYHHRWLSVAIENLLTDLQTDPKSAGHMTAMQMAYIAGLIRKSKPPERAQPLLRSWVTLQSVDRDGLMTFSAGGRRHLVLPDGRGIEDSLAPGGIDVATGRIKAVPFDSPLPPVARAPLIALVIVQLLAAMLAILLLVAAIVALARPVPGIVMLRRWSLGKLVLAGVELSAAAWLFGAIAAHSYDLGEHRALMLGVGNDMLGAAGEILFVGLLWPAIVLATLRRSKTIRDYQIAHGVADPDLPDPWRHSLREHVERLFGGPCARHLPWPAVAVAAVAFLHILAALACRWSQSPWDRTPSCRLHIVVALLAVVLAIVLAWRASRFEARS